MRRVFVPLTVLALTLGACGSPSVKPGPTPAPTPVPTASTGPSPSASPVPSPAASPSPSPQVSRDVVYFARDRLPPVGVRVDGAGAGATAEERVVSRLKTLFTATAPSGLFNIASTVAARPSTARIEGDLVTIDFAVPNGDWGTQGSSGTRSFVQQIVYTASEEPGVRRVLITENGHEAIIGGEGLIVDHPVAREDVAGYTVRASADPLTWDVEPLASPITVGSRYSVDAYAPALTRFVVDTGLYGVNAMTSLGFSVSVAANDERARPELGKWILALQLEDARSDDDAFHLVERTPLRSIKTASGDGALRYELGLDDLRPWRVAMLYEPLRVVLDVGGDPDATSANIALYRPAFGATIAVGDEVSGFVRAFEAQYTYRIRDSRGALREGSGTASLGTSELWGSFGFAMPPVSPGGVTLEIVLYSPRDGSLMESVFTSLVVRG